MTTLVVIYDSTCGGCSTIASQLSGILAPEVLVRSCKDPNLSNEYPVLRRTGDDRPCRKPTLITIADLGRTDVTNGWRMIWRGLRFVAPGRRWQAVRLGGQIVRTKLRRGGRHPAH